MSRNATTSTHAAAAVPRSGGAPGTGPVMDGEGVKYGQCGRNGKDGMILAFTLLLLVVMSLMAIVIVGTTLTELSISGHNSAGREAFNAADGAAKIATVMGRLVLHPELGDPEDIISSTPHPDFPQKVEPTDRLTLERLEAESVTFDPTKRYDQAVNFDPDASTPVGELPHILFKVKDKVVAAAVLSLDTRSLIGPGSSLGTGGLYDTSGGPTIQLNLVVTVNGSSLVNAQGGDDSEPHSIITAIYRESL